MESEASNPTPFSRETFDRVAANISRVMRGQEASIRLLLAALASGGHVLLEDYPGTGKTTLAKSLARSLELDFKRLQFTPDLLPSDILGVSIYNQKTQEFEFHDGPIFTHVLLADEINRASPRTQAALLEAMGEGQVSIEGTRRVLARPFFVIATQNPVEFRGTYPLPEAQMDRFALQFSLGYVPADMEVAVLTDQETRHPLDDLASCLKRSEVMEMQEASKRVRISEELKHYIVNLVRATRSQEGVTLGASPRASLALMKLAQALALFAGRDFVVPDDIREVAVPCIAHRLVLDPQARFAGRTGQAVTEAVVESIPVPA